MKANRTTLAASVLLGLALSFACGGSDVDAKSTETPSSTTGGPSESMLEEGAERLAEQKDQLREKIAGYETTLAEKQTELEGLLSKLKNLSPSELLGDEAKRWKTESVELQELINVLRDKIEAAKEQLAALDG